jgi:hypothetical protein
MFETPDPRMSTTQPAVVNFGATPDSVELREVPLPQIHDDEVLFEVEGGRRVRERFAHVDRAAVVEGQLSVRARA